MLFEKTQALTKGDVVVARLSTGEELLARFEADAGNCLTVTKPVLLQMQVNPETGQIVGFGIAPFMIGAPEDGKFHIKDANLLTEPMHARNDIATMYLERTSPIKMPPKNIIV